MSNQSSIAPDREHAIFRAQFDKLAPTTGLRKDPPAPETVGPWTAQEWQKMLAASPSLRREWQARQRRKAEVIAKVFPGTAERREYEAADVNGKRLMAAEKLLEAVALQARAKRQAEEARIKKVVAKIEDQGRDILAELHQLKAQVDDLSRRDEEARARAFNPLPFADQVKAARPN